MKNRRKRNLSFCVSFFTFNLFLFVYPLQPLYPVSDVRVENVQSLDIIKATTPGMQAENFIRQNINLIAEGAKLELVSKQFRFTEGPATDKKGNVFFTDQPNDKIWKYSTDGQLSVFMEKSGRANGLFFDKKGNLLACADEHNQLWSISHKVKLPFC